MLMPLLYVLTLEGHIWAVRPAHRMNMLASIADPSHGLQELHGVLWLRLLEVLLCGVHLAVGPDPAAVP